MDGREEEGKKMLEAMGGGLEVREGSKGRSEEGDE